MLRVRVYIGLISTFSPLFLSAESGKDFMLLPENLGRGNTGISRPRSESAMYFNPAGLQSAEPEVAVQETSDPKDAKSVEKKSTRTYRVIVLDPALEASTQLIKVAQKAKGTSAEEAADIINDNMGKPLHAGVSNSIGFTLHSVGFQFFQSGFADGLIHKDPHQGAIDTVDLSLDKNIGIITGYSHSFLQNRLSLGSSLYLLQRTSFQTTTNIADLDFKDKFKTKDLESTGQGIGMHVGATYKFENSLDSRVGAVIRNLGTTTFSEKKKQDSNLYPMKQEITIGYSHVHNTMIGAFIPHVDLIDLTGNRYTNTLYKLHLGLEYVIKQTIGFTGGINEGYKTGSLYLDFQHFRFDAGAYSAEMGNFIGDKQDFRVFFRISGII